MYQRLLACLLHVANSSPPFDRTSFYAVKDRLLRRYGQVVGYDVQHIRRECWGDRSGKCGPHCLKCYGTGVYTERWVHLSRWQWLAYTFHRPEFSTFIKPSEPVTISGLVQHKNYGLAASESALWLYLLTGEFRLFWRELSGHYHCFPGWWPMLNLQRLTTKIRMVSWRQRCWCGRWFWTFGSGWQICRKCRKAGEAGRGRIENCDRDSIPF